MYQGKTAGELCLKAASDSTRYDPLEVAMASLDKVGSHFQDCIVNHNKIFNEDEYFICFVYAGDPLLANITRRNFYADLFLPEPRPEQAVFWYSKKEDTLKNCLWVLPKADEMIALYETPCVEQPLQRLKEWSEAFFDCRFWSLIRKQHNFSHLSQIEYSYIHREELIKASGKKLPPSGSNPFDFSKITTNQIVDTKTAIV